MDDSDRPEQDSLAPEPDFGRPEATDADSYLFPRQPKEVNRLDLQHFALREALGANYLAPVHRPRAILDAGTGTGRWAFDLCQLFPHALVAGLDTGSAPKEETPPGFRFLRADIAEGLPFAGASFDFVHQRLLRAGIPLDAWPRVVEDLVRVTRPGGVVELVEIRNGVRPSGPATRRLFALLLQVGEAFHLDLEGPPALALDKLLNQAGVKPVRSRYLDVPAGEWGGRKGSFMASNMRAMFTGLSPVFEARCQVPAAQTVELVRTMLEEIERFRSQCTVAFFWGRKPALEAPGPG
ncbi:MAG: class I SAM-dependent methyltransferase [Candidatus Dormibacteraceae bacterium]